jgi:uncharacterized membrane protein HdeD (DUF308 family)
LYRRRFVRLPRLLRRADLGRLPGWLLVVLGMGCVVLGAFLVASPLHSLRVLAVLVAVGLLMTGVAVIASASESSQQWLRWLAGAVWIGGGVVALSWPGITIGALAIAAGIALVVGGVLDVVAAVRTRDGGTERVVRAALAISSVLAGAIALTWPEVTVLVMAVLFGVRTAMFGLGLLLRAWRRSRGRDETSRRRLPAPVRIAGAAVALTAAVAGTAVSVAVNRAQPGEPGAFYTPPDPLSAGGPGTLLRHEVVDDYVDGATTYRVLYRSTGVDGEPTAVSGLVLVPDRSAPEDGRDVVAYTHGTVGVTPRCAPSLQDADESPLMVEGGQELIDAGYVVAASDYEGLGTPGVHPYLIGRVAAQNALDGVRAAQQLEQSGASNRTVVWGHSQGGHASLFTGQLAAS